MNEIIQFLRVISLNQILGFNFLLEMITQKVQLLESIQTTKEITYPTSCTMWGYHVKSFFWTIYGHINLPTFDYAAIFYLMNYRL